MGLGYPHGPRAGGDSDDLSHSVLPATVWLGDTDELVELLASLSASCGLAQDGARRGWAVTDGTWEGPGMGIHSSTSLENNVGQGIT